MTDERFQLHLLVSRENGAQLLAIPLNAIKPHVVESRLRDIVDLHSNVDYDSVIKDALDAALRETSSD